MSCSSCTAPHAVLPRLKPARRYRGHDRALVRVAGQATTPCASRSIPIRRTRGETRLPANCTRHGRAAGCSGGGARLPGRRPAPGGAAALQGRAEGGQTERGCLPVSARKRDHLAHPPRQLPAPPATAAAPLRCPASLLPEPGRLDAGCARRLIGRAAHELGEFGQAELAFRRALGVAADCLPAWAGLARLAAATGNNAAAIEANEKTVG